ncbi:MAG TPA: MBL fold metallo-hydrolase [Feifaniaceae bacterium]|nr:MBL fold metallo-hydrolase [Feifaniaceae bacterium]
MEIICINVGYGDSIFLQSEGYRLLVDGGSADPNEYRGDRTPALAWLQKCGVGALDAVVVSHIHEDHVGGLEAVLGQLAVKELWLPCPAEFFYSGRAFCVPDDTAENIRLFTQALNAMERLVRLAEARGTRLREVSRGAVIALGGGLKAKALGPDAKRRTAFADLLARVYQCEADGDALPFLAALDSQSNDASLMLKFTGPGLSMLLPGDCCPHAWPEGLTESDLRADVFKLPHHGQIDSVTADAIRAVRPRVVLTTSSSDRRYNSSNPGVYRLISSVLPADAQPDFLFSDEADYPPYTYGRRRAQAVRLNLPGGGHK